MRKKQGLTLCALLAFFIIIGCGEEGGAPQEGGQAITAQPVEPTPQVGEQPVTTQPVPNALGMTFVSIPKGSFQMGSPSEEPGRVHADETLHDVTLTQDFEIMTTEVTQKMWFDIMGENPSYFKGDTLPVEQVSWNDAQLFVEKLNAITNDGYAYRLPTEAEWEYAARSGTQTAFSFGDYDASALQAYGWFVENSQNQTHPVAQKKPNVWGLYDMHGHLWEWVLDNFSSDYSKALSQLDANSGNFGVSVYRVFRGGGLNHNAWDLRSASRSDRAPGDRGFNMGFRLVRTKK
ncbi:MAG: formylglycine-generating enzyme family protein [Deltaproteobacteria bacterium]|nr:formylglycine-generating enzyme family protein [Deltaproteobacteria bacterium]